MKLFPHQNKALELTKDNNRVAYYLDMGLGKTFVGSEKMFELNENVNLVVCQKSKIDDWIKHFFTYYIDASKCDEDGAWCYNLTNANGMDMFFHSRYKVKIGVINYELSFRRRSELSNLKDFTLMLDESSMIQNEKAKRSKFILKMQPKNVILLSGTPTSGKYERLWSQLKLLGWKISKDLFYKQYVEMEWTEDKTSGFRIPHITGYKNVDRLKRKLAEHGAIFMKSNEVFDLPEQIIIPIYSEPSREYRRFLRDEVITVKKLEPNVAGYKTDIECELIGDTMLTKRLYARQLCSQFSKSRLEAFEDLINSTNERIIVFYNFNEELNLIHQIALKKTAHISIVNGSRKDLQAYSLYDDSITLIQYQAGAMGLNLQKANQIIYFSLTDNSELFEQSKKRIHRIGQEKTCFYYYMLSKNTVEEDILETLKLRKSYNDELFRKHIERMK